MRQAAIDSMWTTVFPVFLLHKVHCVSAKPLQSSAPSGGGGVVIEGSRRGKT